ncbi:MAG: SagB family peptide dehydrogenase [Leptolyngbya sp. SIO1E4]|nr:SagB family peptide dehydrogenase [Leptolyngbya sp. SIO1E4]
MADCFTLSFRSDVALEVEAEQISLRSPHHALTLEHPQPGLKAALEDLKYSALTLPQLVAKIVELDGPEAGLTFEPELQKLVRLGWICYSVLPLATAIPIAEPYHFADSSADGSGNGQWQSPKLSRFAFLHQDDQQFVLESPLSKAKIILWDWRAAAMVAKLATPNASLTVEEIAEALIGLETTQRFIQLLIATGMATVEPEPKALTQWEFHSLLFHHQTRLQRLDDSHQAELPFFEDRDRYPILKPPMSDQVISLVKPDLTDLIANDMSLTQAIETRQSLRDYDDQPISVHQLGEFLYRCVRVKEVQTLEEDWLNIGEFTQRPYPCGGALYELEIYPVVNQCQGLAAGLYHYQPLSHTLHQLVDEQSAVETLLYDAWKATGQQDIPQVLLIITARFGRLFWKYPSFGYGLILKHIGVLYQTFYLVATAMQLAPCAIGSGNSEQFCKVAALNEVEESSVGEFSLGSLKRHHHELT